MAGMVVKNNMSAINTLNTLNKNHSALSKSLQKVSSGMRINSAADDASGYAISERMRVQIRSLDQDNKNTQNGNAMMKVAEGAVQSTVDILKTLKEKVINAANDTNTDSDRAQIQKELDQSIDQIDDNANITYNGKYLVDGSHNNIGKATYTSLSNQSLAEDTKADTKLTDLKSRTNESLNLDKTDKVTVSYVQGGKTYSATFEIGDKTLQDIFTEAENIDTSSKLFATTDNESIKAAGGVATGDTSPAETKAIAYLRDQLESTRGPLLTAMQDAKTAFDQAAGDIGSWDGSSTGTGAAKTLGEALKAAGIEWKSDATATLTATPATNIGDGKGTASVTANTTPGIKDNGIAALHTEEMQAALKAAYDDPTNAGLKEAVEAYEAAYTKLSEAGTAVTDANAAATKAADQLNALEKQQAVTDAAAELESLKKVTIESVERKLNAAGTDAKANYTKLKTDATYDSAADSAVLSTDDIKKTVLADIAKAVNGITDSNKNSLTIKIPESGTAMDLTDLKAAATTLKTAKDGMAGIESDLKSAQDEVVAKFNGPTVLTGKEIGLDKAGKVVTTANGDNAITVTANAAGVDGQISGFTISVSDAQGNIKKSANAALDNFNETIRAENESKDNAIVLQTGTKANQAIKVGFTDMRSEALGLKGADGTKLNISTQKNANAAINVLDNAIQKALDQQTTIGSVESRLEYTSTNLTTASENVQASESTIRDADMAKEMTEYTKNNVLLQAAQSMLAQANQNSSSVLSLLQ